VKKTIVQYIQAETLWGLGEFSNVEKMADVLSVQYGDQRFKEHEDGSYTLDGYTVNVLHKERVIYSPVEVA
jgi:hypothetical protein